MILQGFVKEKGVLICALTTSVLIILSAERQLQMGDANLPEQFQRTTFAISAAKPQIVTEIIFMIVGGLFVRYVAPPSHYQNFLLSI